MVTLRKIRDILGPDCSLSDVELELLRGQLVALADVVVEVYCKSSRSSAPMPMPRRFEASGIKST